MKKTIFARLMLFSLTIIMVCSVVLGGVHFFLIERYTVTSKIDSITKNAERISTLTEFLIYNYDNLSHKFYGENLNTISQSSETYIVLTDIAGTVIQYSSNSAGFMAECQEKLDVSQFLDTTAGRTVVKKGIFNNIFDGNILTAAAPLKRGENIYGMVLVNYPLPRLNQDSASLISLLLISILASSFVALLFSYFLSANISKPIKQMGAVARDVAKGNFNKRSAESNIRELDELSEAFNTMAAELEKTEEARSSFIANVSHDLRTPMTSITGFVDGILDGTIPPERQNHYLTIVSNEAKRLSSLVNTFLDTSQYEVGEIKLNRTVFDINEMIRTILISQETRILEKNIQTSLTFDTEKIYVYGDEAAIHRVLANLVDNATKFTESNGEIAIVVTISGKKAVISVENSGQDISQEDQKYIWDRFYKADKSRGDDKKGSGLGLFIVKNIVNQHGEKIQLTSGGGKTKFTFSLPVSKS